MVQSVCTLAVCFLEIRPTLLLVLVSIAPHTSSVVAPTIVGRSLLLRPALGIITRMRELQDGSQAASCIRNLANFSAMEDSNIVCITALTVVGNSIHTSLRGIEELWLTVARLRNFDQVVSQHVSELQLKHHATAEIEGLLGIVEVDQILSCISLEFA